MICLLAGKALAGARLDLGTRALWHDRGRQCSRPSRTVFELRARLGMADTLARRAAPNAVPAAIRLPMVGGGALGRGTEQAMSL
jgi:hypothetical protein